MIECKLWNRPLKERTNERERDSKRGKNVTASLVSWTYLACVRFDCFVYVHVLFQSTATKNEAWFLCRR